MRKDMDCDICQGTFTALSMSAKRCPPCRAIRACLQALDSSRYGPAYARNGTVLLRHLNEHATVAQIETYERVTRIDCSRLISAVIAAPVVKPPSPPAEPVHPLTSRISYEVRSNGRTIGAVTATYYSTGAPSIEIKIGGAQLAGSPERIRKIVQTLQKVLEDVDQKISARAEEVLALPAS